MIRLLSVAKELQDFCQEQNWRFCFIGGLALQRWGEPRVTKDADLIVLTSFLEEEDYVDALLSNFEPRRPDAREFALRHRVLLLKEKTGVPMDVSLAGLPFEEGVIERSSLSEFVPNISLRTCSAEDLVVLKSFAARSRDWGDVETIIARQKGKLDWEYILRELAPLAALKEEPEIVDRLKAIREKKQA